MVYLITYLISFSLIPYFGIIMQNKCFLHLQYGFFSDFRYITKYWNSDRIEFSVENVRAIHH